MKDGRISIDIQTAQYPASELHGTFLQSSGSIVFSAPPAAPQLADTPLTANDAARFLIQSTFGPTRAEIDALTGKRQIDLNNWITAQLALPASSHDTATDADYVAFAKPSGTALSRSTARRRGGNLPLPRPTSSASVSRSP